MLYLLEKVLESYFSIEGHPKNSIERHLENLIKEKTLTPFFESLIRHGKWHIKVRFSFNRVESRLKTYIGPHISNFVRDQS